MKIGYKASAEQFAPRELVEYAVRAESGQYRWTALDIVVAASCSANCTVT